MTEDKAIAPAAPERKPAIVLLQIAHGDGLTTAHVGTVEPSRASAQAIRIRLRRTRRLALRAAA